MKLNFFVNFFIEWKPILHETDPAKKAELFQTMLTVETPKIFGKFNEIIIANGGTWLVGTRFSWSDLMLANTIKLLQSHIGDKANLSANYPALEKLSDNVYSIPNIKAYVDKRDKK